MPNILTKVGKNGTTTYQAVVRVDVSRPIRKTFPTYEEAEAWRVATDAEERAKRVEPVEPPAYEFLLAEVLEDFRLYWPDADMAALRAAVPALLEGTLAAIEPEALAGLPDAELDLLERAIEHGRQYLGCALPENPAAVVQAARVNLPFRPVTSFEEDLLIESAGALANGSLRDFLIISFDTGLSQTEAAELTASQVDIASAVIRFSEGRLIPLTERAREALIERLKTHPGKLFDNVPLNTIQTAFIRLKKALGLNGPDFNDIRKIAIIRLSEKMPIDQLKAALGYARYAPLKWLTDLQPAYGHAAR